VQGECFQLHLLGCYFILSSLPIFIVCSSEVADASDVIFFNNQPLATTEKSNLECVILGSGS
jgi:hypothetical protein